jgi:sialate O-acetylesterase
MIYPLRQLGLRGILWYQGESNANNAQQASAYREQFQTLIQSWRTLWGQSELPFLYVQLANFRAPQLVPGESNWTLLRESQTAALELPQTGQAVIIDLGEADDIHPRNKQDVGRRLALLARRSTYGQEVLAQSPTLGEQIVTRNGILLTFDHVGDGLEVRNKYGYVHGFAIAGEDKQFVWAGASIQNGNEVVVWSEKIPEPRYVRYGWADNPDDLNLYNSAGLPVAPFRTDEE